MARGAVISVIGKSLRQGRYYRANHLARAVPWVKSLDQWFCPVHWSADWVESEIYSKFRRWPNSCGAMGSRCPIAGDKSTRRIGRQPMVKANVGAVVALVDREIGTRRTQQVT
jgi:hypothetical protein